MKLLFFCPRWGSNHVPWRLFLNEVKAAGFDGVEIGLPGNERERDEVFGLLQKLSLKYILQHYETSVADYRQHRNDFASRLTALMQYSPVFINSHTGRDFFADTQNTGLLKLADDLEQEFKVPILHETHRSRFSYAAHHVLRYLKHDWLKLTLDVSHWFCVAETLLFDQEDALQKAIEKTHHIHARIGHEQGPQVYDFEDAIWQRVLERHFDIWDRVITFRKRRGYGQTGITTEFGPWPYMPVAPSTISAQQYQFQQNVTMMMRFRQRYDQ